MLTIIYHISRDRKIVLAALQVSFLWVQRYQASECSTFDFKGWLGYIPSEAMKCISRKI